MTTATTPITLHLTTAQAQALDTFLWTASIPWNSVGPAVNRKDIERELAPISNQLNQLLYPANG